MSSSSTQVLGIVGSLRQASLHRRLLAAAQKLAPTGMTIDQAEIDAIPIYNADVQAAEMPPAVVRLGEQIASSDAVLIVSPEYNYSFPGVLKNAIDWVSRLPDQPLADKPVAIMGGSPGPLGGSRMQYQLRQVFIFLDAKVMARPEVMIPMLGDKFDASGNLADQMTADFVVAQLNALAAWTQRLKT